eukprot:3899375-Prymnesium_polylepis.1
MVAKCRSSQRHVQQVSSHHPSPTPSSVHSAPVAAPTRQRERSSLHRSAHEAARGASEEKRKHAHTHTRHRTGESRSYPAREAERMIARKTLAPSHRSSVVRSDVSSYLDRLHAMLCARDRA